MYTFIYKVKYNMKKLPKFRIIQSGHCYYIYLTHGRKRVKYFGKIVEGCATKSGNKFTYVLLKFDKLAKLHLTKSITFSATMANNKVFNVKEKDWFFPFQRAVLFSMGVERHNARMISKRAFKFKL
jgi:hypothetical protein